MPTNNKTFVNVVLRYEDGTVVEGISDFEDIKTFLDEHEEEFARVRHGRWEHVKKRLARGGYVDASECSVCHKRIMPHLKPNYCPNCGAKMDK